MRPPMAVAEAWATRRWGEPTTWPLAARSERWRQVTRQAVTLAKRRARVQGEKDHPLTAYALQPLGAPRQYETFDFRAHDHQQRERKVA